MKPLRVAVRESGASPSVSSNTTRRVSGAVSLPVMSRWSGLLGVGTLCKLFALSVALTFALASAALADQVTNRVDVTPDPEVENITLDEGATQTVNFRVVTQGGDGDAGCNIDAGESLTVQVTSSDTSVATVSPQTLTFTACTQDKSTTVTAGARGTATITVAQASGAGSNTTGSGTYDYAPATFTATVNNVAPTISNITDQSTDEDTATSDIPFTVGDAGTPAANLTVSGSSDNTTLVPNSNITFGGSGASRTVKVTPAANRSGTATITVTISDGAATSTDTFVLTVNAVNDAPTISSVTNDGPVGEGSPATITVTANDVEGDTLSYEFDCDNDSTFEIGPQSGNTHQCTFSDNGTRRVNVRVTDGNGGTATDFTNVTVNNVAPNAVNDTASAQEGGSNVVMDVLANDTDVSGDPLTITGNTQPPAGEGSVSCSANDCTFTPNADFNGTTSFGYTIGDGDGGTDTATVTVTVNATNDAPVNSVPGAQSTAEDNSLVFSGANGNQISTSDLDAGSSPVQVTLEAANGKLTLSGTAGLTFTTGDGTNDATMTFTGSLADVNAALNGLSFSPDANYNGSSATLSITTDDQGNTGSGGAKTDADTVNITVNGVNDAPSFTKGANQSVQEDAGAQSVPNWATGISTGPADESGQTVSFIVTSDNNALFAAGGRPAVSSNGTLTYTPAANATGTANVEVVAQDSGGTANGGDDTSDSQSFTITVNGVNDDPTADAQSAATNEDSAKTITLAGSDVDGDTLTFEITEGPSNGDLGAIGSVSCTGTTPKNCQADVTYTPDANYNGSDSFKFRVNDGTVNSTEATVSVTVDPTNDRPGVDLNGGASGIDYSATFTEHGGPASIVASGALSVADVDDANIESAMVKITNLKDGTNESLTADTGTTGITKSYNSATGELSLSGAAPRADYQQVLRTVTYDNASQSPDTTDRSVTFVVNDGDANSDVATSTVAVGASNDAPVNSVPDAQTTDRDTTLVFSGANGNQISVSDVDAGSNSVKVTLEATGGKLTLSSTAGLTFTTGDGTNDATMTFTGVIANINAALDGMSFTPDTIYSPTGTLTITTDDQGNTGSGGAKTDNDTVNITVNFINVAPTASPQLVTTNEDSAKTITLSGSDVDGDGLTFEITNAPTKGTLGTIGTVSCTGTTPKSCQADVTYTPEANYNGSDSFKFRVNDGSVNSAEATVSVTIVPVNDAPTISNIQDQETDEDTATPDIPFTIGDAETAAADLTVSGSSSNATLVPNSNITFGGSGANRTVKVTPEPNRSGTAMITVEVSDGLATSTDTFILTVNAVNDVPTVALSGPNSAAEGSTKDYDFTVNDPDAGDTFTVKSSFPDCGTDGTFVESSLTMTSGGGSFRCRFPDGPASTNVRIQVADAQGADSNVGSRAVSVANVAPSISLTGPATADEGDIKTYNYTVTDPGVDTHTTDTESCGANGVWIDTLAPDSFECRFPDGPATTQVTATVSDSDGAADADNQSVEVDVANVAPTVVLNGPASANEGDTKTYSYTVTDPGDPSPTITESCGANGTRIDTPAPDSFECRFPDGPANSNVSVAAVDPAGGNGNDLISVQVANVAPTVELTGPAAADEGQTETYSYTVSDPGADPGPTTIESCGANADYVDTPAADNFRCTFAAGPATSNVNVNANDGDDAGSDGFAVDIRNVAPTISNITNQSIDQDTSTVPISFTVGDAGTPAVNLTVTGSSDNPALVPNANIVFGGTGANRTVTITPASGQSGTATITVSVRDGAAATTSDSFVLTVNAVDTTKPTVTQSKPTGTKVSPNTMVTVTFSEAMNEVSVETPGVFTLKKGTKTISAEVDYNSLTQTVTLDPIKRLRSGATYTATVLGGPSGAKDLALNALATHKVWKFKVR